MNEEKKEELSEGTIFNDDTPAFRTTIVAGDFCEASVLSKKDEKGDYPTMFFYLKDRGGKDYKLALWRDELAAITFALSRADQQSKLLNTKFREYKEVPVRLVVQATKDIKKGDYVVAWRKERVPIDSQYTKF